MAPNYGHGRLAATPRTPRTPRKREEAPEVDPCANVACCGFSGLGTVSGFDAFLKGGWSSLFLAEDMLDQMLLEEAVAEEASERVQVYLQVNHDESWIETLICIDESARASPSQLVTEAPAPAAYTPWYMLPLQQFTQSSTPKSTVEVEQLPATPTPVTATAAAARRTTPRTSPRMPPTGTGSPRILSLSLTSNNVSPTIARVGDQVMARVVASGDVTKPRVLIPFTGQEIPMHSGRTPDALDGFERVSLTVKYLDETTETVSVSLAVTAQVWEGQCTLGGANSEPDTAFRQPLESEEDEPPASPSTQLTATVVGLRDRFGLPVGDAHGLNRSDSELIMELSAPKILSIAARSEAHHGMAAAVGDTVCLRATFIEPVRAARFMIAGRTLKATSLEVHVEAATVWGAKWVVEAGDLVWGHKIPFGVHEFQDESRVWHCERLVGPMGEDPATGQQSSAVVFYDSAAYPGNYKGDLVETTAAWLADVVGTSSALSPSSSLSSQEGGMSGSDSDEASPAAGQSPQPESERAEALCQSLRDGVTLMGLMRKIRPGLMRGRPTPNKNNGPGIKLVSRAESNIVHVLDCFQSLGVPEDSLFLPDDLLQLENPLKVVKTLHQLGNLCFQVEGYVGPCVGSPDQAARLMARMQPRSNGNGNGSAPSTPKPRTPARHLSGFAVARAIVA